MKNHDGRLVLPKELTRETTGQLQQQLDKQKADILTVDCHRVQKLDSAGAAFLDEILFCHSLPKSAVHNLKSELQETWKLFSSSEIATLTKPEEAGITENIGAQVYGFFQTAIMFFVHLADVTIVSLKGIFDRRSARHGAFIEESLLLGVNAAPIVSVLSLIIGLILSLQSAAQLRLFGANIYMADLLAISVVREMAPMMTAIILAGRSGSSVAAELSTMSVSEEIDALRTMGIDPIRYLTTPKMFAITLAMPLLVTLSVVISLIGGMAVAIVYLNLTPAIYTGRIFSILSLYDLTLCYSKSFVFGWMIVIIGSYCGFSARGGAQEVGRMTTASVVASIFAVILIDVFFSFAYLGQPL